MSKKSDSSSSSKNKKATVAFNIISDHVLDQGILSVRDIRYLAKLAISGDESIPRTIVLINQAIRGGTQLSFSAGDNVLETRKHLLSYLKMYATRYHTNKVRYLEDCIKHNRKGDLVLLLRQPFTRNRFVINKIMIACAHNGDHEMFDEMVRRLLPDPYLYTYSQVLHAVGSKKTVTDGQKQILRSVLAMFQSKLGIRLAAGNVRTLVDWKFAHPALIALLRRVRQRHAMFLELYPDLELGEKVAQEMLEREDDPDLYFKMNLLLNVGTHLGQMRNIEAYVKPLTQEMMMFALDVFGTADNARLAEVMRARPAYRHLLGIPSDQDVSFRENIDVIGLRLLLGADPTGEIESGKVKNVPLCSAARKGLADVVETLLDAGADVNAVDAGSHTAIEWAQEMNDDKMMKLLLDRGSMPPRFMSKMDIQKRLQQLMGLQGAAFDEWLKDSMAAASGDVPVQKGGQGQGQVVYGGSPYQVHTGNRGGRFIVVGPGPGRKVYL